MWLIRVVLTVPTRSRHPRPRRRHRALLADAEHLTQEITDAVNEAPGVSSRSSLSLAEIEERHIKQVMRMTVGNKLRAARILGISRPTLIEKLKRMDCDEPDIRQCDM